MSKLTTMKDTGTIGEVDRVTEFEVGVSGTALGNYRSAPKWIELLPAGDFAGRDGRGPFRLSNPEGVIAATDGLRMEAGLPIDYDHATDLAAPAGRPAPAAGWIRGIEVRDGALWGEVEWTRHGATAVVTHEYRYISPVFEYSVDGEVQRLLRAALTNNPNLYLTAIAARAIRERPGQLTDARRDGADERASAEDGMDELGADLRELFGLGEQATSAEIMAEARSLMRDHAGAEGATTTAARANLDGEGAADPARYVPIAQFENALTELNRMRAANARERASYRVEAAMKAGKITPAQREWAIAYCQANLGGFEDFVARQPAVIGAPAESYAGEPATASRRRESDRDATGGGRAGAGLTRTELTVCTRLGLPVREYLKRRDYKGEFLTSASE